MSSSEPVAVTSETSAEPDPRAPAGAVAETDVGASAQPDLRARERALAVAYRALGRRDHTEAELRAVLERRDVAADVIDWAVDEIRRAGYLDDGEYARRFAEDRRALDGWGSERIVRALGRRGVAPDLVAAVVAGRERDDELTAAAALLGRRFPTRLEDDRERARAWRVLVTRGYDTELAYEAVRNHERTLDT